MTATSDWTTYFGSLGINCQAIPSNPNAVQLTNLPGCPIFRGVDTVDQLNDLHTKARQKSSDLQRLLIVGLPFDHPQTVATFPGSIVLPKARVYAGHIADTFSLSGHLVESEFLRSIKQEVQAVMSGGTRAKTPICDWVQKLLNKNWVYGTPSSLAQLDTMLGLLTTDTTFIGHVRARMLSFGRGCGESVLLPQKDVILKNNSLIQSVDVADLRFISVESEMKDYSSARARIHPVFMDKFLTCASASNEEYSKNLGCASLVGPSSIGSKSREVALAFESM